MPAKSARQQRYMAMCAHSPGKARGKCPSHKVSQEFSHKPKGGYKKLGRKRMSARQSYEAYLRRSVKA